MYALRCLALVAAACDTVPLTAPQGSALTIYRREHVRPNWRDDRSHRVRRREQRHAVQNGTTVRFTTNLGRMEPVEAQTTNGYAVATFVAGDSSGVADVTATSGGVGARTAAAWEWRLGTTPTSSNVVRITVGAAAVETVVARLRIPVQCPPVVELWICWPLSSWSNGRSLSGIPVTFASSEGQLSSPTATTDASGQARTS